MKQQTISINPKTLQVVAPELGVQNIITIFAFILDIRVSLIALFKKFSVMRLVAVGTKILEYGNIVQLANQAWAEFKDLKPAETKQVVDGVNDRLELPEDQAELEAKIEEGLLLIPEGHALVLANIKYVGKVVNFFQGNKVLAA